jgi:hypothetical protein
MHVNPHGLNCTCLKLFLIRHLSRMFFSEICVSGVMRNALDAPVLLRIANRQSYDHQKRGPADSAGLPLNPRRCTDDKTQAASHLQTITTGRDA